MGTCLHVEEMKFGENSYLNFFLQKGELGDGTNTQRNTMVPLISENENIIKISAGQYHSLMLKKNGKVYSFGKASVRFYCC